MPAWPHLLGRLVAWCLVLLGGFSMLACTSPEEPAPEPSRMPPLNTIESSEVGDRLTVTASVVGVPAGRSFVVQDADLPDQGLLVLSEVKVREQALVTVEGTIQRFAFARFGDRYELTDEASYRGFEGRKVLVADEVRSWAGTSAPG